MVEQAFDLDAYFRRIDYVGSTEPSLATLTALQRAHGGRIPFENLDVLLGRPIRLEAEVLQDKLVRRRRGGYCFEQNSLFLHVLRALGFEATVLAARVLYRRPPDVLTPRTHMLLRVQLGEGPHLVDVGFGGATPTVPLVVVADREQVTPLEPFRLVEVGSDLALQVRSDGNWTTLYRFAQEAQHPVDLELPNWFVATHPDSFFVSHLMAALPAVDGRHALLDLDYSFRLPDGAVRRQERCDPHAIPEILGHDFQIELTRDDRAVLGGRLEELARIWRASL